MEDWPFGLEELEPYYDKVEYEVGVSGKAGNINGKIDPRGNIFEGPRKREYPMPPLRGTEFTDRMAARRAKDSAGTVSRAGGDQFAGVRQPAGLRVPRLLQPRRLPRQRQELDGGQHHPEGAGHRPPQGRRRTRTSPRSRSTKAAGASTGVNYLKGGQEYFQPADVVLLAGYTYENVRLLLLSKSKAFPNGLVEQPRPGRQALLHATTRRRR